MEQRIDRIYKLTEAEHKAAIHRYLKEVRDRPVPAKADDPDIDCDPTDGGVTVEYREAIDFPTKET
jgi:hypothetical protein